MELGNMMFGNSRGQYHVNRDLQDEFCEALCDMGFDNYGHHDQSDENCVFQNDVFWIKPYYWGDCQCGYDEREADWSAANKHSDECYQMELRREKIAAGGVPDGDYNYVSPPASVEYAAWRKIEDKIYRKLCAKHGLDHRYGCAVHCTCEYETNWIAWSSENGHSDDCPIVQPNFWHKPSGFRLDWYKYPLRDSYSNQPLSRKLMRSLFADCKASMMRGAA